MAGRQKYRLKCQTINKQNKLPCKAKGILMKNGNIRCRIHGGWSSGAKTLEGKIKALREFINYVKYQSQKLGQKVTFTNDVKNNFVPLIGFSDDDPGNIESIKKFLDKEYEESPVKTYLTKGGDKLEV